MEAYMYSEDMMDHTKEIFTGLILKQKLGRRIIN